MGRYDRHYGEFPPYVPVAERRRQAARAVAAAQRKGAPLDPVQIEGRAIARTFWGKAWCTNLETYSDFYNRLARGRSYVREGRVMDLQITKGKIVARVMGSSLYTVNIAIRALDRPRWEVVLGHCSGKIDSLVELLQGKFSRSVMEVITCRERGVFPAPKQIVMDCSCPDGAVMCKHVAAVLYGVGARLDAKPELFFQLRNIDYAELITAGTATVVTAKAKPHRALESADLSGIFGIEIDAGSAPTGVSPMKKASPKTSAAKTSAAKKRKTKTAAPRPAAKRGKTITAAARPPAKMR